jgi:TfoX/Sxy family transcriptional regulator of competence genes
VIVAFDEQLAERIRELVQGEPGLSEKKMFGGLAFLIGGNMAIAASGQGGLLVRVDPADSDRLVSASKASVAVMQGREMPGWLRVAETDVTSDGELTKWVKLGVGYAGSLPAKQAKQAKQAKR